MAHKFAPKHALSKLYQHWPRSFNTQQLPLKCHIYQDIMQEIRHKDLKIKSSEVFLALRFYTQQKRYRFNILNMDCRIDLKGDNVEAITSIQRKHARAILASIPKSAHKNAAKRAVHNKNRVA